MVKSLSSAFLAGKKLSQNGFLHMQPILRLVNHNRLRAIQHIGANLLSPMGWQAVHDDRVGFGPLQESLIELVGGQDA
jgi:hypothetical protein